jgi:hypothetical protein
MKEATFVPDYTQTTDKALFAANWEQQGNIPTLSNATVTNALQ